MHNAASYINTAELIQGKWVPLCGTQSAEIAASLASLVTSLELPFYKMLFGASLFRALFETEGAEVPSQLADKLSTNATNPFAEYLLLSYYGSPVFRNEAASLVSTGETTQREGLSFRIMLENLRTEMIRKSKNLLAWIETQGGAVFRSYDPAESSKELTLYGL